MKPVLGDYFYLLGKDTKTRHKINFLEGNTFEWGKIYKTHFGWGDVGDLKPNLDKKSKVKWVM